MRSWSDELFQGAPKLRFPVIFGLLGIAAALAATSVDAADWPMWRCDAERSAATPHELPSVLKLQWTQQFKPRIPVWDDPLNRDMMRYDRAFEPIVSRGRMFVAFNDTDKVMALDVTTGEKLWTFYTDGPVRFSPVAYKERLFFVCDDGYLYCVSAVDGDLRWRIRGGPTDRKVIGNRRVISAWPARGGPVVRDGRVYFAASIWPFMGTFIYALDAESGELVWLNDGTSASFMKQPHNAPAFAGVAPQGQLVATSDALLVPGGRSCPAALDRHSGELKYFHFGGKGQGGAFVAADQSRFYVHSRLRGTLAFRLDDGAEDKFRVNEPVLDQGKIYSANTPGDATSLGVVQAFSQDKKLLWQVAADGSGDLIKAGDRLYAAGKDSLVAIDLPTTDRKAQIAWSVPLPPQVVRLLAAEDRLFAVTLDGKVLAYGEQDTKAEILRDPVRPLEKLPHVAQRARRLLDEWDVDHGYALWFGVDDGRLLEAVAAESNLHFVAVDPDEEKVDRLRRRLDAAGLYGTRVVLHVGDAQSFRAPPYMARVVVFGDEMLSALKDSPALRQVYESVRPYGGRVWLPVPDERRESWTKHIAGMQMPKAQLLNVPDGLTILREGALPGAASWTHAYGDIANTVKSNDQRIKLPLGLLWFGGNSNEHVLPRHGHGPSEQVVGGRLFIEGMRSMSARDVYTGQTLWKRDFPNIGNFEVYYDDTFADTPLSTAYSQVHIPGANARGTNYVATEEGVYVVLGGECHFLDAATGKTLRVFRLTDEESQGEPQWGFIGVYEDLLLAGVGFGNYSQRLGYVYEPEKKKGLAWGPDRSGSLGLRAFNRHTGDTLWQVDARHSFLHNGIVAGNGRIYCLDKLPKRVQQYNQRRGIQEGDTERIVALDAASGQPLWETTDNVFGSWLSYSTEHDILLLAGSAASDRSLDEIGSGMSTYRGVDGSVVWKKEDFSYAGPCILHGDAVITNTTSYKESQGAFSIHDGSPLEVENPLTGAPECWRFTRTYGCNTAVASEHLLTFRSGAAGFYDLSGHSGTGNFGGFKSGCSSNLIVADGVLNAPEYTRTCSCGYQNQTSLALVHMPENEMWTYSLLTSGPSESSRIRRLGVNFEAPGDRLGEDRTLWLEHPDTGGATPEIDVIVSGSTRPFRYHSSRVSGAGPSWVAASGMVGARSISLRMASKANEDPQLHTVQLVFVEPDPAVRGGQRVFDVTMQGKTVLHQFDVCTEAGGAFRSIVKEFRGVAISDELRITLAPTADLAPVICGVQVTRQAAE